MEPQMHMHMFDTHKLVKAFLGEGFKENQAEILVKSLVESREYDFDRLATKEQLNALDKKIDNVEERLSNKIDNKINEATSRMIKWVVGLFVATLIGVVVPIIMKLF